MKRIITSRLVLSMGVAFSFMAGVAISAFGQVEEQPAPHLMLYKRVQGGIVPTFFEPAPTGGMSMSGSFGLSSAPVVTPGTPVTYKYTVENDGNVTLTDIVVKDDNGTPKFPDDDFVVGTLDYLDPGMNAYFTATVIPVISTVAIFTTNTVNAGAIIIVSPLASGDIKVTYVQDFGINDNTYGTGAIGWGTKGHTFGNLTGSDKLEMRFKDKNDDVVLDFYIDTVTAAASVKVPGTGAVIPYPSGYGTMGPFGGDGFMVTGNPSNIVTFSTSISDNLNLSNNLAKKATLIVNSPTFMIDPNALPSDTNVGVDLSQAPGGWAFINTYSVVIKGSTFGDIGFGSVEVPDQHNSPSKIGVNQMVTKIIDSCVTNTATATALFDGVEYSSTATAEVCLVVPPPVPLPSPFLSKDIGAVNPAGSATWSDGTASFTVSGSGKDIGGSADAFFFVYHGANGDCRVVARVVSVQKTDNAAKAVVMIRDSLSEKAREASVAVTPGSGIIFSFRTATGGTTSKLTKTGLVAPYWVMIDRTGNAFKASYSADGTTWNVLGSKNITMGAAPYIGIGVTSHHSGTLCTAVFDNVTATP